MIKIVILFILKKQIIILISNNFFLSLLNEININYLYNIKNFNYLLIKYEIIK